MGNRAILDTTNSEIMGFGPFGFSGRRILPNVVDTATDMQLSVGAASEPHVSRLFQCRKNPDSFFWREKNMSASRGF